MSRIPARIEWSPVFSGNDFLVNSALNGTGFRKSSQHLLPVRVEIVDAGLRGCADYLDVSGRDPLIDETIQCRYSPSALILIDAAMNIGEDNKRKNTIEYRRVSVRIPAR